MSAVASGLAGLADLPAWWLAVAPVVVLVLLPALPLVLACAYLLGLTLLSGPPRVLAPSTRKRVFDVIVPAHDEVALIGDVVASLRALDWPAECLRVCVVADNCSDATAARARTAGATVWERHDAELRGKGHALAFGFEASRLDGRASAVVVVDADSLVSANLLEAIAARLQAGAEAVQVHHGVLNPQASWRTRLMAIALGSFHRVRSRGRERLGLSCGIRGNGWCVTHALLQRVPYRAFSLAEDIEFGLALGLAGVRVHAVDEAEVAATMVVGAAAARTQRQRWESGRWQLLRAQLGPLLRSHPPGRHTRRVCLDLAADLLVPPLSWLVLGVVLLGALAVGLLALTGGMGGGEATPGAPVDATLRLASAAVAEVLVGACLLALGCALALTLYVLRGWQLSGVGWRGLADLARAPSFVLWKLLLMLRAHDTAEWVRTQREGHGGT